MEFDKNKIDQKLVFMNTCLNKLKKLKSFDKDGFIDDFTKVECKISITSKHRSYARRIQSFNSKK
ncbi:hypothetical protein [Clostridium manihotivorum]|uniref:hypothetical protein n=1 Tax=Clostridium manihotivorum TaxID=2320868 RepID=UPI001EE53CE8|nr:hypothetical protein [Clostridium manihotivorum]